MPFSKEDKALTTNLYQFQNIRLMEDSDGIFEGKKEKLDTYLKKPFGKQEAPTIGARAADQSTRVLKGK